jgi:hypothetical protein
MRHALPFGILICGLSSVSFAQRGGAPPSGGRPPPQQSAEEATRAANAKEWADAIEKLRAKSPPPPLPQIRFPTKNESFLGSLRWAENPRAEVARYLDNMWKEAKELVARRSALQTFWHDAEKPAWVRPAIEEFFRQRSNGMPLRPPPEPAALNADARASTAATTPPLRPEDAVSKTHKTPPTKPQL